MRPLLAPFMVTKQTSSPAKLLKRRPPVRRFRNTCRRVMDLTTQRGGGAPAPVEGAADFVVMLGFPASSSHQKSSSDAPPNGPGVEPPSVVILPQIDRRPPARVAYRCARLARRHVTDYQGVTLGQAAPDE